MRSSSGVHHIALDHVRACAIFMVIAWHFTHGNSGYPVPFQFVPSIYPFALFDEGHTGVALFMTLSGYLFALLLAGKSIGYAAFLRNRVLRLVPLLAIVIILEGMREYLLCRDKFLSYLVSIACGPLLPILPNGGWSITVEFHFYVMLPLFLWMLGKSRFLPLLFVIAAVAVRFSIYQARGEVQSLAYMTIVGHIDQFALGMIMYQFRSFFQRRHALALAVIAGLALFYWYFDGQGGFYRYLQHASVAGIWEFLPRGTTNPIWIILPTIEGLAYSIGIAWYETSFTHSTKGISRFVGLMGEYSYSIYLLHFFVVFYASNFVHTQITDISNFYLALLWSFVFLLCMMPIGYLSFRFLESPFLRLRKRYIVEPKPAAPMKVDGVARGNRYV
jgi:peptidoglycan/LPS O-acetylase OafA/YrhL